MSYDSTAEPIKVGYLMDFTLPPGFPEDLLASFTSKHKINQRFRPRQAAGMGGENAVGADLHAGSRGKCESHL